MADIRCYYNFTLYRLIRHSQTVESKTKIWLTLSKLYELQFNVAHSFKLSDKATADDTTITLYSLNIHKRIGTHNTINADFRIEHTASHAYPFQIKSLIDHFSNVSIRLEASNNGTNYFDVADYYCVVGVTPRILNKFSSGSNTNYTIRLSLTIASWDVYMDMTKYSRAYTGKRLASDILANMMPSYNVGQFIGDPLWVTNSSDMRVLRLAVKKSTGKTEEVELRLPYLVQFNETDYNFLLRNANRCGEFLYFERGQLNLGLRKIEDGKAIQITQYTTIESLSTAESTFNATLHIHNPLCDDAEPGDKPYVSEYNTDAYFDILTRDGYDSGAAWENLQSPQWSRVISSVLQYQNLSLFAELCAFDEIKIATQAQKKAKKSNQKYQETYFDQKIINNNQTSFDEDKNRCSPFADFYTQSVTEGKTSRELYSSFGDIPASSRPDSKFYWDKSEAARKCAQILYKVTFDSSQQDIQLGDIVKVDEIEKGVSFVVVDICSDSSVVNKVWSNTMAITLLPISGIPVPLPAETDLIRRSGAQSAVVVETADPKRLGRIRVRYHWQAETDDATPWIRVAVPFASDDESGAFSAFTKGDEVMVDYEGGNIERPYVVGSLYNFANKPPFGERGYTHILRSRNGHTIGFREPTDASTIYKSLLPGVSSLFSFIPEVAKRTNLTNPDKDRDTLRAMGGIDITDTYGIYSISTSSDKRKISISSPFGTVNMDAAMGISISAPNGNVSIKGKNVSIEAGNNLILKSGTNIDDSLSALNSKEKIIKLAKSEATLALAGPLYAMVDFSSLRYIIELAIKPISGTLKLHSGRYMMLEAGEGEAQIPTEVNRWINNDQDTDLADIKRCANQIEKWITGLAACKSALIQQYKDICSTRRSIGVFIHKRIFYHFEIGKTANNFISEIIRTRREHNIDQLFDTYLADTDGIEDDINRATEHIKIFKAGIKQFEDTPAKKIVGETLAEFAKDILKRDVDYDFKDNGDYDNLFVDYYKNILRCGIHQIMLGFRDKVSFKDDNLGIPRVAARKSSYDNYNDKNWKKFIESVKLPSSAGKTAVKVLNQLDYPVDIASTFTWSPDTKPQILFSERQGVTHSANGKSWKTTAASINKLIDVLNQSL